MTERDQTTELDRREFLRQTAAMAAGTMGLGTAALGGSPLLAAARRSATRPRRSSPSTSRAGCRWRPPRARRRGRPSTDVSEAHTAAQVAANQKVNEFVGAPEVIAKVKRLLDHKGELDDLTVRQLEKVRLRAAEAPGTVPEVVKARTEAEAKQAAAQDGFVYVLKREGKADEHPSANDIDRVLVGSQGPGRAARLWEVSKTIGGPLARRDPPAPRPAEPGRPGAWASTTSSRSRSPTTA